MNKRKSSIHEHQNAVEELDFSRERQIEELGSLLAARKSWNIDELKELYNTAGGMAKEVEDLEKKRKSISDNLEKQQELKTRIAEIDEQEKQYTSKRRDLIGSLGAQAYRVYRGGILKDESFGKVFAPINKIAEEIRMKESTIQEISGDPQKKNLLQKFSGSTRTGLQKASIVRLEKKRDAELPRIGEDLVRTGLVEDIPDEQVRSVTSAIKHLEEQHEEQLEQKESLQRERQQLSELLEQLIEAGSAEKELKRLDSEITVGGEKLQDHYRQLGRGYIMQPSLEAKVSKEVETVLNRIHELDDQKKLHQDQIHNLQALIEIDELQEGVKKKEEQIARLEKRIAEDRGLVEKTRDELVVDKDRIEELRKVTVDPAEPSGPETEEEVPPASPAPPE